MKTTGIILLSVFTFQFSFAQPKKYNPPIINNTGSIKVNADKLKVKLSTEEMKLYTIINEYRKSKNLPIIPLSVSLSHVAQTHSIDLEKYRPGMSDTCNLHSWSDRGKWVGVCYTPDHKNVDLVYSKPRELTEYKGNGYEIAYYNSATANAVAALEGWKGSPGHNKMMLNAGVWGSNWKAIGIGIYKNYATVWFGREVDVAVMN